MAETCWKQLVQVWASGPAKRTLLPAKCQAANAPKSFDNYDISRAIGAQCIAVEVAAAILAHLLFSKCCDRLPLYRQREIYGREGLALDRSTLCDWAGQAA